MSPPESGAVVSANHRADTKALSASEQDLARSSTNILVEDERSPLTWMQPDIRARATIYCYKNAC